MSPTTPLADMLTSPNGDGAPSSQGTWPVEALERLCTQYHGPKGSLSYRAYAWLRREWSSLDPGPPT